MTDTLDLIQQGIDAMFAPTDIVEVRVPKAGKFGTIAGYFEASSPELAKEIQKLSGQHDGIYVTLNPCKTALLARAKNRIKTRANLTTSDHDIDWRTHLLVDIDPVRPAGVSATDEELEHAKTLTRAVYKYLRSLGWAEPVIAESGNGMHLVYNVDLPNDQTSTDLVKTVLKNLAAQFDNEFAKVDTSVFNAARIVKAYGSLAAKGDSTEERPHRIAQVLKTGKGIVTLEQLQTFAPIVQKMDPKESPTYGGSHVDIDDEKMEEFLAAHGIGHHGLADGAIKGQSKWVLNECPFNPDHTGKDAAVFLTEGKLGFRCLHNSCTENHWKQFRIRIEELSGKKVYFGGGGEGKAYSGKVLVGVWSEADAILQADIQAMDDIPVFPEMCLEGSYIGELASMVTKESYTEPVFAYNNIKVILGALTDGYVGYPNQPALHMRTYSLNVSSEPECGKGYSRQMTYGQDDNGSGGALKPLVTTNWGSTTGMLAMEDGNGFGSGEKLLECLSKNSGRRLVLTFDEMKRVWDRLKRSGNILDSVLLELYGNTTASYSTMKVEHKATNVRLNISGDFTLDGFRRAFEGTSSIGNGLLSRCVFAYAGRKPYGGDTQPTYPQEADALVEQMLAVVQMVQPENGFVDILYPDEEPIAKTLRLDYQQKITADQGRHAFADRILHHMKQDLLLRALFSSDGNQIITPAHVERSIAWAEYQIACRRKLWQAEGADPIACMNLKIMSVMNKHKNHPNGLSDAQLCTLCNVYRDGTQHIFERAIRALTHGTSDVEIAGRNHLGRKVYALKEQ